MSKCVRILLVGVTAGTVALLPACDAPKAVGPTDTLSHFAPLLSGLVVDSRTRQGIPGVSVEIAGLGSARTSADGTYEFFDDGGFPTGPSPAIRATAPGYTPAAAAVDLSGGAFTVPTLSLTPLAAPVSVGPAGGSVAASAHIRIEIPAAAFRATTPLTVTPLSQILSLDASQPNTFQVAVGVHLGPHGTRPERPIQVTIPLELPMAPGTRLRLRRLDEATGTWIVDGVATVSDDGLAATFSAPVLTSVILEPGIGVTYEFIGVGSPVSRILGSVQTTECKLGYWSGWRTYRHPTYAPDADPFPPPEKPYFSASVVEARIQEMPYGAGEGLHELPPGEWGQLIYKHYLEHYRGQVKVTYHALVDGKPVLVDQAYTNIEFRRIFTVAVLESCHVQGGGGGIWS